MEQKDIFELISRFEASSLTKLEVKQGDTSLLLERERTVQVVQQVPSVGAGTPVQTVPGTSMPAAGSDAANPQSAGNPAEVNSRNAFKEVKSPIVGVFYAAQSPDAEPFVRLGERVTEGQVLCLIEAMKMMNELKSPVDGIIRKINGVNGELVEFDQVIFEVEPC